MKLLMGGAGRAGRAEKAGRAGRAEKNGKAGRAGKIGRAETGGTGETSGNRLSKIFFWVLVGN